MNNGKAEIIDSECLRFLGGVNAAISHELKNILAIISETSGFLDDLAKLARQGNPFDLSILENSNKSIAEEIERGFHTIRQMNEFAHSVDEFEKQIDPADSLTLAVNLTRFLSIAKPVIIEEPQQKALIQTVPFLLANLFYTTLTHLFSAPKADEIRIRFEFEENAVIKIIFSGVDMGDDHLVLEQIDHILDRLSLSAQVSRHPFELCIVIPAK